MTILEFLSAQYDTDAQMALAARGGGSGIWHVAGHDGRRVEGDTLDEFTIYDEGGHDEHQAAHIANNNPARVLCEVAVKRWRLARHQPEVTEYYDRHGQIATFTACEICSNGGTTDDAWPCDELMVEASVYLDRPGYDEGWCP